MKHVLYIGPDHRNHRGGIGAVLEVYSKNIHPFKFIPTYETKTFLRQFVVYLSAIWKLFALLITDKEIRILHVHHASRGSFLRKSILILIGRLFRKQIILHIHGGGFHNYFRNSRLLKPYIRYILEHADAVICLSENWKKYYSETFKLRRLVIINNVIEDASISQVDRNGIVKLLFLGHITEKKGVYDLLNVLGTNLDTFGQKVTFTIGGIGDEDKLNQAIGQYKFNGDVKFAGWVSGSKKAELLNECDVYVLPSYNEGLPISILEAMSYGKPIIATNVGGIPEIVKPGFNGWLFEPGDRQALGKIIGEVIGNRNKLSEFGYNSLQITKDYTPAAVVKSLQALYENMLNNK